MLGGPKCDRYFGNIGNVQCGNTDSGYFGNIGYRTTATTTAFSLCLCLCLSLCLSVDANNGGGGGCHYNGDYDGIGDSGYIGNLEYDIRRRRGHHKGDHDYNGIGDSGYIGDWATSATSATSSTTSGSGGGGY